MTARSAPPRRWRRIAGGLGVILASLLLMVTLKKRDTTLSNQAIVDAVRRGDFDVINAVPPDPSQLAADLASVAGQLDDEGSQLATILVGRYHGPESTPFLIAMTRSAHLQAAVSAAMTLGELPDAPPSVDIARSIRSAVDPLVRAQLYLVLGRSHEAAALAAVRLLHSTEQDSDARDKAAVAAARLGGDVERAAFLQRISGATSANAKDVYDDLLYVGDVRFAKGMLPWLDQHDPVTRIGSDAEGRSARLCDLAVWTALRLGIKLPVQADQLDIYDDATLAATRAALQQLADP
jgi:hypothetical protein